MGIVSINETFFSIEHDIDIFENSASNIGTILGCSIVMSHTNLFNKILTDLLKYVSPAVDRVSLVRLLLVAHRQ